MNEYIRTVCKIGQGAACCKYLGAGTGGLECLKVDPGMKRVVDKAWAADEHVAQGDNCEGQENLSDAQVTESKFDNESENRETSDAPTPEKK